MAIILLSFAVIRFGVSQPLTRFLDNVHWTTAYLLSAVLAWMGVRASSAEHLAARRWFAWGLSAYAVGQVLWDVQVAVDWNPFPGPSDLFFSCLGPGCALGLWTSLRTHTAKDQGRTVALDVSALTVAVLALALALYLPKRGDTGALALAVLVYYPVTLLGALCIGVILMLTLRLRGDRSWTMFMLALLADGALWMHWNSLTLDDALQDGTWFNFTFSVSAVALGLGAMWWQPKRSADPRWDRVCEWSLRLLPLMLVVVTAASLLVVLPLPAVSRTARLSLGLGSAVVVILAMVRQSMLLSERERLLTAEQRMRVSEKSYKTLFETAQEAIFILRDGRLIDCNARALQMFGASREQILAHPPGHFSAEIQSGNRPALELAAELIAAASAGQSVTFEWKSRRLDGTVFDAEVSLNRIEVDDQLLLQAIIRDITARKVAEQEVKRQAAFAQFNPNPVIEFAAAGEISYCNEAARILAQSLGRAELGQILPPDTRGVVQQCIATGQPSLRREIALSGRTISWSFFPVKPTNTVHCYGGDITERRRVEVALKDSVEKLSGILSAAPVGIGVVVNRVFLEVNEAMCRIVGYSREEIIGREARFLYPTDEEYEQVGREYRRLAENLKYSGESRLRHSDGRVIDVAATAVLIDHANPSAGAVFTATDITERKRTEATRENSLSLTRATLESTADGILVVNNEGKIVIFNRRFAEMWRLPYDLLASSDDNRALQWVVDQLSDPGSFIEKVRHLYAHPGEESFDSLEFKDGRWFERFSRPQLIEGKVVGRVWSFRDITDRKRTEDELRWRTAFFEAQVDSSPDGILVVDSNGKKILQNQRMGAVWKIPPEVSNDTDDASQVAFGMSRVKNSRQFAEKVAYLYSHPTEISRDAIELVDGTVLDRYSAPVLDRHGKYYGRIWTFRDITGQRQLEEQLRQSQKMEAIGQLSGGVAHDFNNLLTVIKGHLGLLRMKGLVSPGIADSIQQIDDAANRAAQLTRQLLTFSRQQVMQPVEHNLNGLVNSLTKMLRRLVSENIDMVVDCAPQPLAIKADEGMVEQVLLNLVVNARDAMPTGGTIRVSTSQVELDDAAAQRIASARPGSFVCLTVSDTGTGIVSEILPHIFEPFFTTKGIGKGTGLGLATVYGVMQQHDGWITVESEVQRGATFRCYFPRLTSAAIDRVTAELTTPVSGGHEKILLVEDEPAVRSAAEMALAGLGYRVLSAPNGLAALQVWELHKHEIELLLTDMVMPEGVTGRDLAQRLQTENPRLPIVYMSGYNREMAAGDFTLQEGRNYLPKPFDVTSLAKIVRMNLDRGATAPPFGSPPK